METGWLLTIVATSATVLGAIVTKLIDHWLSRGKLRDDEATKIRAELRAERDRKDTQIAELEVRKDAKIDALEKRIDVLEDQLEKAEQRILEQERSKLAVYRTLVEYGASKDLVNAVLAIQEG
jgi:polyhydroxyalkanoate synthesis regulator phasin